MSLSTQAVEDCLPLCFCTAQRWKEALSKGMRNFGAHFAKSRATVIRAAAVVKTKWSRPSDIPAAQIHWALLFSTRSSSAFSTSRFFRASSHSSGTRRIITLWNVFITLLLVIIIAKIEHPASTWRVHVRRHAAKDSYVQRGKCFVKNMKIL